MKKLYIDYNEWNGFPNPRLTIMVVVGVFVFINSCILMGVTTTYWTDEKGVTHSDTPLWSILTINLSPFSAILFWFLTTNEEPKKEEDSKKYIRIEIPDDTDMREKYFR
jgi:hypothetical protein